MGGACGCAEPSVGGGRVHTVLGTSVQHGLPERRTFSDSATSVIWFSQIVVPNELPCMPNPPNLPTFGRPHSKSRRGTGAGRPGAHRTRQRCTSPFTTPTFLTRLSMIIAKAKYPFWQNPTTKVDGAGIVLPCRSRPFSLHLGGSTSPCTVLRQSHTRYDHSHNPTSSPR